MTKVGEADIANFTYQDKKERYLKLVRQILILKDETGENIFHMGWKLKLIREEDLFLAEFKTWEEFIDKRIGMSLTTARDLIRISREFSLKEFVKFGFTKLLMFGKIEDANERSLLMKKIPPETPVRKIEEDITKHKAKTGISEVKEKEKSSHIAKEQLLHSSEEVFRRRRECDEWVTEIEQHIQNRKNVKKLTEVLIEKIKNLPELIDMKHHLIRLLEKI